MNLHAILDFVFPSHCVGCGTFMERGKTLCGECSGSIPLHKTLFCGVCASRLPAEKKICHQENPYILAAAADYGDARVRGLIHALKFKYIRAAADPLAELIAGYLERLALPLQGRLIIPVPLGRKRMRTRGFNQSELVAERLARRFGLSLDAVALIRARDTAPQSERADFAERNANVADCFAVPQNIAVAGKSILLVDDVSTSGATLREAAATLKRAGAKSIIALVAAKA
ncbi:MAG: phosphoribosyltransferase family protein [Patescibacteria group bacterium]